MAGARFGLMTVLLMLFALLVVPAQAQDIGKGPHVRIELVAESDAPAPGSEVTLAFVSTPEPEWHGYWQNPGDAGIGTTLKWTVPAGVEAGTLQYPVPERLLIAGLMNYVYEKPFTQLVTLKIPAGMAPGATLPVRVQMDYLVCTLKVCVPERAQLAIDLKVGDGAIAADKRAKFDQWRAALPKPLGSQATYEVKDGVFRLGVPFPADAAASNVYFFPITDGAVDYAAPQTAARDGDRLVIETKAKGSPGPIEGVLAVGEHRGFTIRAVPGSVLPAKGGAAATAFDWTTALLALGGAILGGLLLNIMPCVFPILSLKALSLAKSNDEGASPRAEALAYTAGVVLVCLALGGLLLGLRAGGASLGWAFQLQDPRVILVLLLLVLGIALNLAGMFEVYTPRFAGKMAASGKGGAFMTGALAAFVATPCAGPFMASALGAALILPWPAAMAVFGGLGVGIALPFLLLGFVPALRRRLPKPGAWMDKFRKILSVPMFLTALALAWVLGRQIGVDGMAKGLFYAYLLSVAFWVIGARQARGSKTGFVWAFAALVVATGVWQISRIPLAREETKTAAEFGEPFGEERLAALRAERRPVFAYFTADWCLTCKVNEKAVIETDAVKKALADNKVAVLIGDWTNGDAALGRFIERHNRAGVPLYLWYKPGEQEPRVLPQILTQAEMIALSSAK